MNRKKLLLTLPITLMLGSCTSVTSNSNPSNDSLIVTENSSTGNPSISNATTDSSISSISDAISVSGLPLEYQYANTIVDYARNNDAQIVYNKVPYSYKNAIEYYTPINGLKGNNLKSGLYELIRGHDKVGYDGTSGGNWKEIYRKIDQDPQDANAINMSYTGVIHKDTQFDREHIWPKILGFSDYKNLEPGYDLHNLHPALGGVNSYRGDKEFDDVPTDGVLNPYYGFRFKSDYNAFEPADHAKGDVARTIFYMAVRYEGKELFDGTARDLPDLELSNELKKGLVDGIQYFGKVETLLKWNKLDPVDQAEINRNELIYKDYQHNRNPFIDYPEFADYIFNASYHNHAANISNPTSNHADVPLPFNSGTGDLINGTKIMESIFTGTTTGVGTSYSSNKNKDFTVTTNAQTFSYFSSSCLKSGTFTLGLNNATDRIDEKFYSPISGMTATSSASVLSMNFDNINCNGVLFNIAEFYPSSYPNYLGNFKWYVLESINAGTTYNLVKSGSLTDVELYQIAYVRPIDATARYALVISATGGARLNVTRISTYSNATIK